MLLTKAEWEKMQFYAYGNRIERGIQEKMKCKWGYLFCRLLYVTVVGHMSMGLNTCLWFSHEFGFFKISKTCRS